MLDYIHDELNARHDVVRGKRIIGHIEKVISGYEFRTYAFETFKNTELYQIADKLEELNKE